MWYVGLLWDYYTTVYCVVYYMYTYNYKPSSTIVYWHGAAMIADPEGIGSPAFGMTSFSNLDRLQALVGLSVRFRSCQDRRDLDLGDTSGTLHHHAYIVVYTHYVFR